MSSESGIDRRHFIKSTAAMAAGIAAAGQVETALASEPSAIADSLCHATGWETLNPGYWQTTDGQLRRRIKNYGDRARATGFPYHYETHQRNGGKMPVEYDPSLPPGVIYRKEWKLTGAWSVTVRFIYHGDVDVKREGDSDDWRMYQPGYSLMGLAFGSKSLFESFNRVRNASFVGW
ncbi:MAG: hypothetical protein AB8G99_27530, partial [Planctomycetaceae bacterium]